MVQVVAMFADILLLHDAPAGVRIPRGRNGELVSTSAGLDSLVARTRPRLCFVGHHHTRVLIDVDGVPCIGLN
jgi:Icc-related predicted phosphoesterase